MVTCLMRVGKFMLTLVCVTWQAIVKVIERVFEREKTMIVDVPVAVNSSVNSNGLDQGGGQVGG